MENTRSIDLRFVIGLLVVAAAAMTIWAATALAGGSSSAGTSEPATDPAAAFIQDEGESQDDTPRPQDCPERDGDGGADPGSSDTGSDL